MEDRGDIGAVSGVSIPRSDSKFTGEKRKRGKLQSDEINSKSGEKKEGSDQYQFTDEEISQVTEAPVTLDLDASQEERIGKDSLSMAVNSAPRPLDLNTEICVTNDNHLTCNDRTVANNSGKLTSRGIGLDLNAEDVPNSISQEPLCDSYTNQDHFRSRDVSECGSSVDPPEEKDPLRSWKQFKQNGFLSTSHGGISMHNILSSSHGGIPVPKQRGRKSKNDMLKKKMELAKREQVDRFTKIAAPSGLLNELNPGIINHVRNRKQVHSIIEALVRSEKFENSASGSKQASHVKTGRKDVGSWKDRENLHDSGTSRLSFGHEDGPSNALSGSKQTSGSSMPMGQQFHPFSDEKRGDGDSSMVNLAAEDDILALKLSSSTKVPETASSLSNEESANFTSAASLSVKAATVASQWLELLHQDIKGRLTALRRSKKRVRAVITTELPFLISKEFSSNQENDPHITKHSAEMHQTRWSNLFDQMDQALSEEEKQLENWLNQVRQMQVHCDQGLQHMYWTTGHGLPQMGTLEFDSRFGRLDSSEKELAVRAAAAAIYSTCNFLSSKEDVSCF